MKPLSQRKLKMGEEKQYAIEEKVEKLKSENFITEIKYRTWLANMVLVQKSSNKQWICIYFTNLNVACPKDPYILPNIDKFIDGSWSYKTLSFMDVYSSYNQIKMEPLDVPKTTFMYNHIS